MNTKDLISICTVWHNVFIMLICRPDGFVMLKRAEEKEERAYFLASTESKTTGMSNIRHAGKSHP
jgi:hypothetical protein